MITKNLTKALEDIGFTYVQGDAPDKSHVYAIYGGYLISIFEKNGNKVAYFNFKFSDNEENELKLYEMSSELHPLLEEYSITDYTLSEDGMRVYSNGNIPTFLKLIDTTVSLLIKNEIRGTDFCSECGNKFGNRKPKKVNIGTENHIMCEHCAIDTIENANAEAEEKKNNASNESPLFGILLSVAGGIIGALIYIVLYNWISPAMAKMELNEVRYIFCIAGFAVAALSYYGFIIGSKHSGLSAYLTVAINSIVFTSIGQYLGVVFEFVKKNNFEISHLSNKHFWLIHLRNTIPADVADLFVDNSAIFWKLLVISLMFAIVGAAIFLLSLHDKASPKTEKITVETITIK